MTWKILKSNFFYNKQKDLETLGPSIIGLQELEGKMQEFDFLNFNQDYYLDYEEKNSLIRYNQRRANINFGNFDIKTLQERLMKVEENFSNLEINICMLIPKIRMNK